MNAPLDLLLRSSALLSAVQLLEHCTTHGQTVGGTAGHHARAVVSWPLWPSRGG